MYVYICRYMYIWVIVYTYVYMDGCLYTYMILGTARITQFLNMPEYDANMISYPVDVVATPSPSSATTTTTTILPTNDNGIELTNVQLQQITTATTDTANAIASTAANTTVIHIDHGMFSWDKSDVLPCLQDIHLNISQGEFIGIVGSVGSGKSSLIYGILGQLERMSGTQYVKGKVAYVSQDHVRVYI